MGKSKKQQKLSNLECASFCSQMTMVLHAGFPAVEGVSLLLEDAKDVQEKAILQVMYDEMINTGLLYPALEKTSVFPDLSAKASTPRSSSLDLASCHL